LNMMDGNEGFPVRPEFESATGGFFTHLPAILWQRRWLLFIPALLGLIGAVIALLVIPSTYRSSAVLMVQQPQLPTDVTGGVASELIDRRIARYREQITVRPELVSLIEKHSLYASERGRQPLSKVVEKMRDAISVTTTQSDIVENRPQDRTIAFRLDFDYSEPVAAQAVAQQLMDRIQELDQTRSSEVTMNTVQFLTEQSRGLEEQIAQLQSQISAITAQNGGILSNSRGATIFGSVDGGVDAQIASLLRDNEALRQQKSTIKTADDRDPAVVAAETQLAAARAQFSDSHPDVMIAKARLAEARQLATTNVKKLPVNTIDQSISFNNQQIEQLRSSKATQMSRMNEAMNGSARVPMVQQQIADLQAKLSGVTEQSRIVSSRLMAARAGVRAGDEGMGERLVTVEPPVVPDAPSWPNRWLILGLGIVGGLVVGTLMALVTEMLLSPIRDPMKLAQIMGAQPIGVVPMINSKMPNAEPAKWYEFWKRRKRK
jgi:polysaccharide biosynthesis transport protein